MLLKVGRIPSIKLFHLNFTTKLFFRKINFRQSPNIFNFISTMICLKSSSSLFLNVLCFSSFITFSHSWNLVFPGTKWCGPGSKAGSYADLGRAEETDKCCRDHDRCSSTDPEDPKFPIKPFTKREGNNLISIDA